LKSKRSANNLSIVSKSTNNSVCPTSRSKALLSKVNFNKENTLDMNKVENEEIDDDEVKN
jgi:hypothetical protein